MFSEAYTRRKLGITLIMMCIGIMAGLFYAVLSDGPTAVMPITNGILSGALLGVYTALLELQLFSGRIRRRIRFIPLMFFRIFVYSLLTTIILFLVFSLSRVFWFDMSFRQVLFSREFYEYIIERDFKVVLAYSIVIISLVIFTYQIVRKIGQGFLINIITGKYYHPRKTRRIFLFLSILDAEAISRKLSPLHYFNFVNDIIYDITPPILTFHGKIYHYVDNEMVVYWQPQMGFKNASCIRAYFSMCEQLNLRREYYIKKYKVAPQLRAAMHLGEVVQGEIGHGKTEIDFYGDVLNSTSRLLHQTSMDLPFLLSGLLLQETELPEDYKEEFVGNIYLKGKSQPMSSYQLVKQEKGMLS